ncbi:cytochrome b5-like isoform X2 [Diachasmimorpha longicaudata]|uniref:cytochrome b5-like isoform X2 n=1 Tax=Diachasmimorpha longicaudata TaxID=58733 RepID=UPI0030B878A8
MENMTSPASSSKVRLFTRYEVSRHDETDETWIIIHNSVYDVTDFLAKHPGGADLLIEQSGLDASDPFENVGHSSDARQMMEKYKIGEVVEEERTPPWKDDTKRDGANGTGEDDGSRKDSGYLQKYFNNIYCIYL